MTTTTLTDEYNALEERYQELRRLIRQQCDTMKVLDEMNRNIKRRQEIAFLIFQSERKP